MHNDLNTPTSAVGGPPGSQLAADINAAAEAIKAGNPPPESADAIRRGYEPHDISLRGIYIFGAALVVTLIVAFVIVAGVMKGLLLYDQAVDPVSSPVSIEKMPNAIPLQPSPQHDWVDRQDMEEMRARVQSILNGTGQHGDRRWIPINQAMDQVLPMLPIGPGAAGSPPSQQAGATSSAASHKTPPNTPGGTPGSATAMYWK